jgi:hypothetical protein
MGNVLDLSSYPGGLSDEDKAKVDELLINITNANTDALTSAVNNMQFNNIDQVESTYCLHQRFSTFWYLRTPNQIVSVDFTLGVPPRASCVPPGVRVPQVENHWFT